MLKAKQVKRAIAWTIFFIAPRALVERLCESGTYAEWLDPKGWFGAA